MKNNEGNQKKKGKGLIIVLIALFSCILIVGALVFWYINAFSSTVETIDADYVGVWEAIGMKEIVDSDDIKTYDENSTTYVVIDNNMDTHMIAKDQTGAVLADEFYYGAFRDGYFVVFLPSEPPEDKYIQGELYDGELLIATFDGQEQISDFVVCRRTDLDIIDVLLYNEEVFNPDVEIETERIDETPTIPTPGGIIGKWECITQDDCFGYEFKADGTMLSLVQIANGEIVEETYDYVFMNENTIILNGDANNTIGVAKDPDFDGFYIIDNGEYYESFNEVDNFGFNAVISPDDPLVVTNKIEGKWIGLYDDTVYGFEFFDDGTLQVYTRAEDDKPKTNNHKFVVVDAQTLKIDGENMMKLYHDEQTPIMIIAWDGVWEGFSLTCEKVLDYKSDYDYQNTVDKDGMVKNIEAYIEGALWESTGNTFMPETVVNLAGFPTIANSDMGDTKKFFSSGLVNTKRRYQTFDSDEYKWDDGTDTEWIADPDGYFLYVYRYEEELRGKVYMSSGVYFVKDNMLYTYDSLDGVPCSNMIEFKRIK